MGVSAIPEIAKLGLYLLIGSGLLLTLFFWIRSKVKQGRDQERARQTEQTAKILEKQRDVAASAPTADLVDDVLAGLSGKPKGK